MNVTRLEWSLPERHALPTLSKFRHYSALQTQTQPKSSPPPPAARSHQLTSSPSSTLPPAQLLPLQHAPTISPPPSARSHQLTSSPCSTLPPAHLLLLQHAPTSSPPPPAARSQQLTALHATFFAAQRSLLLTALFYQKDERALHANFQSSVFLLLLLCIHSSTVVLTVYRQKSVKGTMLGQWLFKHEVSS